MTNWWLLLNFDVLGALAVYITTLFSLSPYVKVGTAGLCITSAMAYTTNIFWACRESPIPIHHGVRPSDFSLIKGTIRPWNLTSSEHAKNRPGWK